MAQTRPSPTLSRGFTRLGRFLAPYGNTMATMADSKARRTRRSFTDAYKTGAVRLVLDEGKPEPTYTRGWTAEKPPCTWRRHIATHRASSRHCSMPEPTRTRGMVWCPSSDDLRQGGA